MPKDRGRRNQDIDVQVDCGDESWRLDRRHLLRSVGALSVGTGVAYVSGCETPVTSPASVIGMPEAKPGPLLPTIKLGAHEVTRLIAGANAIYGVSHFNRLYSAHMSEYHTTERVVAFLQRLRRAGVNTWQAAWTERVEKDWNRFKNAGGDLCLLLLAKPWFADDPALLKRAVEGTKPIGVAQHGAQTKRLWNTGKFDESKDFLKRIRDSGVLVGLSAHKPEAIEHCEEKGWDIDYYMTGLYEMNRTDEELEKILGERPCGEIYLPSDLPRMTKTIRQASRPCLGYKALAAGRLSSSPEQIREQLAVVYQAIKSTDGVILGMYQRYSDHIGEDTQIVRGILST